MERTHHLDQSAGPALTQPTILMANPKNNIFKYYEAKGGRTGQNKPNNLPQQ